MMVIAMMMPVTGSVCVCVCVCVFFVPLVTIPYQAAAWQVGM